MIINHQHRFCFFAIPRTASKALSKVLLSELSSEEVHRMHLTYREFCKLATPDELSYYKFTIIRNPLDSVVSAYFKKKGDHNGRFSRGTFKKGKQIDPKVLEEYRYIVEQEASFDQYFQKFYIKPYRRAHHEETVQNMDMVLRYECLDTDFKLLLQKLSLPDFDIPVINKTKGKDQPFLSYYTSEIIPQALRIFEPLMKEWSYDFPEEWKNYQ